MEEKNIFASVNDAIEGTEEAAKELIEAISETKGLTRELGPFKAKVVDDGSVEVSSDTGWMVRYPSLTETWAIIYGWIVDWTDASMSSLESFIKLIVFPTSVRLSDIDEQYMDDIVKAHYSLAYRNGEDIEKHSVWDEDFDPDEDDDDDYTSEDSSDDSESSEETDGTEKKPGFFERFFHKTAEES